MHIHTRTHAYTHLYTLVYIYIKKRASRTMSKTPKKYSRPSSRGRREHRVQMTFLVKEIFLFILLFFYNSFLLHFAQLDCKILVLNFSFFSFIFCLLSYLSFMYVYIQREVVALIKPNFLTLLSKFSLVNLYFICLFFK